MNETKARETEVTVPHLAESLVSATIGKWLKKPGDAVQEYEVICELLTEKVNVEMPSPLAGTLARILVGEGETAEVGMPICVIAETEASAAAGMGTSHPAGYEERVQASPETAGATGQALTTSVAGKFAAAGAVYSGHTLSADGRNMRGRYSPAVRALADEHGIDLSRVSGTGLEGRITRKDVMRCIESGLGDPVDVLAEKEVERADAASSVPSAPKVPVRTTGLHLSQSPRIPSIEIEGQSDGIRGEYFIDVTPIRNTIASRMRQSVTEIPHAWTMIEVDVTNLVMLRSRLKDEFYRQEGFNLTYLAFLLKAVVNAIKDYPIMNSVWAVDKIIVKRDINISLAVGTEDSVLTPVIKKADQKNIAGLAREIDELSRKARAGKLTLSDMQGGTFTVNNTGSFGSILSYPIINYPQAAIVTFESIVKRPVVIQDMIAVRSMVNICLSLDHRILDGVICGRFLQRVKENLESYTIDTRLY